MISKPITFIKNFDVQTLINKTKKKAKNIYNNELLKML